MIKSTKKQDKELKECHIGVGFLAYRYDENTIVNIDFFINRKTGLPCYVKNGEPIEFNFKEKED